MLATDMEPTTTPIVKLATKAGGKAMQKVEAELSAILMEIDTRVVCWITVEMGLFADMNGRKLGTK